MSKNTLILNSDTNIKSLYDLFKELTLDGYSHFFVSSNSKVIEKIKNLGWKTRKLPSWPKINNIFSSIVLLPFIPIAYILLLFILLFLKYKFKFTSIVCIDSFEKIIISPVAKLLKFNVIWLELPNNHKKKRSFIINFFRRFYSRFVKVICFTNYGKELLIKNGYKEKNIHVITPGINTKHSQRQENIFNEIAESRNPEYNKKFFTIGTIACLDDKHRLEVLFTAIKKALVVIPNIQLIIVGEGKERKNLTWITKKVGIDNLVWFVGEQDNIGKWLNNFDIYTFCYNDIKLGNINTSLKVMNSGLPIIAPAKIGLEDFLTHNSNSVLLESDTSEELAQHIIKLQQDEKQRTKLGENAKETIDKLHNIGIMKDKFKALL